MSDAYRDRSPEDAPVIGRLSGGGPPEPGVALDQAFDGGTLPDLRKAVLAAAAAAGLPADRAADVMLAVHELAANAVRYGGGAGRARIRVVAGVLQCQVSDAGPGHSAGPARSGGAAAVGPWPVQRGHGLWLVRNAADRINITAGPGGSRATAVFAVRDFPGRAAGWQGGFRRAGEPRGSGDGRLLEAAAKALPHLPVFSAEP